MIDLERTSGFLWLGPELEVGVNIREAGSHPPSPDCSGPFLLRLWVRVLLSYMVWPVTGYSVS